MNTTHHGPLGNGYVLLSLLGFLIGFAIWNLSPSWGFLLILVSLIAFIASFISATRAPLLSDEEMELAIHEKYTGNRYPDTNLHHSHIKKGKYMHSRHKKKLVELHVEASKPKKRSAKKKAATKRVVRPVKKQVKKTVRKAAPQKRQPAKKAVRKPAKKVIKKTKRPVKKSRKR